MTFDWHEFFRNKKTKHGESNRPIEDKKINTEWRRDFRLSG